MATLTVGPGEQYSSLSAAVAAAQNGDTIDVQAGTYTNDFPQTIDINLTIEGVGGLASFVATEPPPNEKGILLIGNGSDSPDVTLENLEFSGVTISAGEGGNGAGVRYQSGDLTIDHSYFHNNQDGLLANADTLGAITITDSEFANNGTTNGLTHNIYVTEVGTFSISASYITAANTGNEIQSRALVNNIIDNDIIDGPTATASYSINLPDGGDDIISGNTIEQGPNSGNPDFIGFSEDSSIYPNTTLSITDNVFIDDRHESDDLAIYNLGTVVPSFTDNSVYGLTSSQISNAAVDESNTTYLTNRPTIADPPFCFCAGTLIRTPQGDVPVERLAAGDLVVTHAGEPRPVMWIGVGRVLLTRGRRSAATPVIIRKGALADNQPHRDLRVTKAHGLYIDDVLIPVEFLINHRSIIWDDHAQEVLLYHVELPSHDVLLANGAPAESYRDDGNRWLYQNANSGWGLPPQPPCVPVMTGGQIVDAAWRRLLERAGPRPGLAVTSDPDLHLIVDGRRVDGKVLRPDLFVAALPMQPNHVRIGSRAGVPQELGTARDPRSLGVALRRVVVRKGARLRTMDAADPLLDQGFHLYEQDNGFRWTDGDATLPSVLFDGFGSGCEVELHVGCTTQYPLVGRAVSFAA
ncbi:MAG TPA: Hint domain-containing protein [Acetobacteraceae bacterium]|nr:Hint domain-containing protein [Acetobacteraceae bacterium]